MTSHKQFGRAPLDKQYVRRDHMPKPYDFSADMTALQKSAIFAIRCIAVFLCLCGLGAMLTLYFLVLTQPPATF